MIKIQKKKLQTNRNKLFDKFYQQNFFFQSKLDHFNQSAYRMNILDDSPAISFQANECKKQFLQNQINSIKIAKDIYTDILAQLRLILRQASLISKHEISIDMKSVSNIEQKQQQVTVYNKSSNKKTRPVKSNHQDNAKQNNQENAKQNHQENTKQNHQGSDKAISDQNLKQKLNSFLQTIKQRAAQYCTSQVSQNIVKFLQIQEQTTKFYPKMISSFSEFIKSSQKLIAFRQIQLQQIQELKYGRTQSQKVNIQHLSRFKSIFSLVNKDLNRNVIDKNISSFDFNRKLLDVLKKQIVVLKLKKRKLNIDIQDRKNMPKQDISEYQSEFKKPANISENLWNLKQTIKIPHSALTQKNEKSLDQLTFTKKISAQTATTKQSQVHASSYQTYCPEPCQLSNFQKIVMINQKSRFQNSIIEGKIKKMQQKVLKKRKQNTLLIEKTQNLTKQIQKMEMFSLCDKSCFVSSMKLNGHKAGKHHTINKMEDLSILDRTQFKESQQLSFQYSRMSINQSCIQDKPYNQ